MDKIQSNTKLQISIVIPTHNRTDQLKSLLCTLQAQSSKRRTVEIIVIDDHSQKINADKNCLLCSEYNVKYFFLEKNLGPAIARNEGISKSHGEWIAFLDDDVTPANSWLSVAFDCTEKAKKNSVGVEGVVSACGDGLWDKEVMNCSAGQYITSNIIYKKSILQIEHGFDDSFTTPAEDQELALRMLNHGTITFCKNLLVTHNKREMNVFSYLTKAPARMTTLLRMERLLWEKHRHNYHTIRYANSFWETYKSILFKYLFSTIKRRSFRQLILHPLQAIVLIIGALIEQLSAWTVLFSHISSITNNTKIKPDINIEKTASLLGISENQILLKMALKHSFLKILFFPVLRIPTYSGISVLKKMPIKTDNILSPSVFIRIDDIFLADAEMVNQFIAMMQNIKQPFAAAITGDDLCEEKNFITIDKIKDCYGEIAMHGFTHTGMFGPFQSELLQMSFPTLKKNIEKACKKLNELPKIFIPPFNAVAVTQLPILASFFQIISTGPESMRLTGAFMGPMVINNDSILFSSIPPFYGNAKEILRHNIQIKKSTIPICITMHLQNEYKDNFRSMRMLFDELTQYIYPWDLLKQQVLRDSKN